MIRTTVRKRVIGLSPSEVALGIMTVMAAASDVGHVQAISQTVPVRLRASSMEDLSRMGAIWELTCTWPTSEAAAMTVMIPKVTSEGERPITLFRTVVRIMAKAKSWRAAGWLEDNSPEYLNMAKGRRVGDGMWRTQLRALISEEQGQQSAEVMLDLHKAFELVERGKLLEAGILAGYPLDVLIWGLEMYSWSRRLVFRGCVTPELFTSRGICAGSAFATSELWLLLCGSLGRIARHFPRVTICIHVDDLSFTACGRKLEDVASELGDAMRLARQELEDVCALS